MFNKRVIKTAVVFTFLAFIALPLTAAQLQVITPEREATKLVIIKGGDGKGAADKVLLKKQIEQQFNVKLKLETNMSRKDMVRFVADREITVNEQNSFLSSLGLEQKDQVIFVSGPPSNSTNRKLKSQSKTKSTKSLK